MRIVTKRNAMAVFYYLMAVDERVSEEEMQKFDEIGREIDPEEYLEYRDDIIGEGEKYLQTAGDDEYYDIVLECVDKALRMDASIDDGIPSRLLVWNMLVIAFSNREYENCERRLIKHTVRMTEMDDSIFLQMEELLKTSIAVEQELEWIKSSNRTYAEVAPIVEELNGRMAHILICAQELIQDELSEPSVQALEVKQDIFDQALSGMVAGTKKAFGSAKETIGQVATPMASGIKKQTGKFVAGVKSWGKPKTSEAEPTSTDTTADSTEEGEE